MPPSTALARAQAQQVATVAEAMVTGPAVHPPTATVADVRAFLADPHRHLALVVDGSRLLATITRADLEAEPAPDDPAVLHGLLAGRTVSPLAPLAEVRAAMGDHGTRRLAVVDTAGDLLGLLCLKASGRGFCSDAGVAARASAHGS